MKYFDFFHYPLGEGREKEENNLKKINVSELSFFLVIIIFYIK